MKRILIVFSSILLLLINVHAQTKYDDAQDSIITSNLKKAKLYLTGITYPYDPAKAFQLNMQCAQAGSAQGMNAVAIQYQRGLGVDSNNVEAERWFKKAAEEGYSAAWYNLGLYYKLKTPPDFKQAYECLEKAATADNKAGYYGQGYMLYKGLGCKQSYKKAVALFQKGAQKGDAACMYYLALALRNGYGTTVNIDSARYWLVKATALGYERAVRELEAKEPEVAGESSSIPQRIAAARHKALPGTDDNISTYRQVKHVPATIYNIQGIWEGYIMKYDWSGQHVISTGKLALQLAYKDTVLTGLWLEEDSLQVPIHGSIGKHGITFHNMRYDRSSYYTRGKTTPILFKDASLRLVQKKDTIYLAGNIQQFSTESNEPARPLYVVLTRSEAKKDESSLLLSSSVTKDVMPEGTTLLAWPNPFENNVNAAITLSKATTVQLQITNAGGQLVYTGNPQQLPAGKHNINIPLNVPTGVYVISLRYEHAITSSIILKQ
ncbi:T9SS type A sorting domain-containing protein [Pinibacter soli]|uniref:T9SS type A sorting domain-containing protein n=1 Tax=Pinibacter soli TaxID=3044211 RepID=A0ABT6R760_9BACT|nr:T9SS type A sorting domain-containing protein [Pinibacter soli]MDI3318225.1 T9SS type A sorting domain-containing protein [Pinibacter soli]